MAALLRRLRGSGLLPPALPMPCFRIIRDDGLEDAIAGRGFDSYDAAYQVLERYGADLCCSDDREVYWIVEEDGADHPENTRR